jgi:hypothetical protein
MPIQNSKWTASRCANKIRLEKFCAGKPLWLTPRLIPFYFKVDTNGEQGAPEQGARGKN